MKSVWLKRNLLRSLSVPDNILSSSHNQLLNTFHVQQDLLIFLEPDKSVSLLIRSMNGDVFEMTPDDSQLPVEAIRRQDNSSIPVSTGKGLLLPMMTDKTSVFGYILLPDIHETMEQTEETETVLRIFSTILYNEAMGSIVQSYNPVLFQVRNLCVTYGNMVKAVNNVSFDICENEFTVVLGTSGCGKTTTVNVLGGMLTPSDGQVLWKGRDITHMKPSERSTYRRETIGFVFQQYNLISSLSARDNVAIASALVEDPMDIDEALRLVGMEEKADRFPTQLSGGEQQRICIARALVKRSSVLICDEPTGALDPENSKKIIILLTRLVKEQHVPVIMITHNPAFSVLADRCILMSGGTILEDIRQPFPLPAELLSIR